MPALLPLLPALGAAFSILSAIGKAIRELLKGDQPGPTVINITNTYDIDITISPPPEGAQIHAAALGLDRSEISENDGRGVQVRTDTVATILCNDNSKKMEELASTYASDVDLGFYALSFAFKHAPHLATRIKAALPPIPIQLANAELEGIRGSVVDAQPAKSPLEQAIGLARQFESSPDSAR